MRPVRPLRSRLTLLLPRCVCEPRAYLNHFVRGGLHTETERVGRRRRRCCFARGPSVSAATEFALALDEARQPISPELRRLLSPGLSERRVRRSTDEWSS